MPCREPEAAAEPTEDDLEQQEEAAFQRAIQVTAMQALLNHAAASVAPFQILNSW